MNNTLFDIYKDLHRNLKIYSENINENNLDARERLNETTLSIETLDLCDSSLKERYQRYIEMQKSFTPEQIDFICYQIGDWYLTWKNRIIVDLEQGTHRLGFAKEQLKTLICGE